MAVGAVLLLLALPATIACLYYAVGWIVGRFPRRVARRTPLHSIAILIPAHDEEIELPKALASIAQADYPTHLISIWVVADHCADATAEIARRSGAECLVRTGSPLRGKGHAVALGLSKLLPTGPDAVLILDADCRMSPGLLRRCDAELEDAAEAVQCAVVSVCDPISAVSIVAAVGAHLDNRMASAADRLGRSAPLRGTGMLFARSVLERHPWIATGLAEDAEYAAELRRHNVAVRFAAGESVACAAPPRAEAFFGQRRRWRAALRIRHAGVWFASKPVILLHLVLSVAACCAVGDGWLIIWSLILVGLTAAIYADAMLAVGVLWPGFRSIWLVGRLAVVALGCFGSRETRWQRTPR